jgi:flavorubredoxin
MPKILVIYHSLSGNTEAAAQAVAKGAKEVKGTVVVLKEGLKANDKDLLDCDGIAIGTPDYFSYMAGGVKDFFDRTFYPTQGKVTDKPYIAFVTHGGGGDAYKSIESMCRNFKFKKIAETVLVKNRPDEKKIAELEQLGNKLAKVVSSGKK